MEREFNQRQGETEKKKSRSSLAYVAAIVAPMCGVLIVIVNARGSFEPALFNIVVAGFVIVIFAVLTVYGIVQPLRPRVKKWCQESRHEELSSQFLPELSELVTQFGEVASTRYQNGIHMAFQSFRFPSLPHISKREEEGVEERWIQTLLGYHQTLIDHPLGQMEFDLDNLKTGSKKSLLFHFAQIFHHLLRTYQHVFVWSYVDACRRVGVENVSRDSREAYAKFQPKFNQFVSSYKGFAKNVNSQMKLAPDQNRLGEYVEDAPPLL